MIKLSKKQWFILFLLVLTFIAMGDPVAFFLASILSFIPAYFYLKSIRDSEKKDVEPWETLGLAFVWGALSGVFLAGIFNLLGTGLLLFMFIDPEHYNLDDINNRRVMDIVFDIDIIRYHVWCKSESVTCIFFISP